MRRLRLVLPIVLALLLTSVPAAAQGPGVGIKGGYLYSSLRFSEAADVFTSGSGWMAGLFFGGNRDGDGGVMGEINLLQKRARSTINNQDVDLIYLQVPVLFRMNFGSSRSSGPSVYVVTGPAVDLKIGEDFGDLDLVREYEGFDVGIVAGLGFEVARIIVEVRGTWGLKNIAKDLSGSQTLRSRTFAVLSGIRFN